MDSTAHNASAERLMLDAAPRRAPLVLVVSADDADRARIQDGLADLGVLVVGAASAEAAIDRARELAPDAIVLDLLMPDLCGIRLAARLQEGDVAGDAPVVGLAAHRPEQYRSLAEAVDCNALLASDVTPQTLSRVIEALLPCEDGEAPTSPDA